MIIKTPYGCVEETEHQVTFFYFTMIEYFKAIKQASEWYKREVA